MILPMYGTLKMHVGHELMLTGIIGAAVVLIMNRNIVTGVPDIGPFPCFYREKTLTIRDLKSVRNYN